MRFPTITVALGVVIIVGLIIASLEWTESQLNPVNYRLLKMSRSDQIRELGRAAGCRGSEAFYMGMPPQGFAAGAAFWSLRCRDGRTFAIMVSPNSDEEGTMVVDCSVFAQYTRGACFHRFSD